MVTDNYLIISSDTHAGLPDAQYKEYLEPQYREAFDEDLEQRAALRAPMNAQVEKLEFVKDWYDENEEGLRGGWDAARRDAELEADGVVGEVIFPDADAVLGGASAPFGAGLGASGEYDPTLLMAGAQAHNRWLAELCSDSPERRCGLAIVPILHDIDAAVAEIRRAKSSGLGGVLIPAMWRPYAPYNDPRYEPIWTVCEELEMVVHTHTGPAPRGDRDRSRHLRQRDHLLDDAADVVPALVRCLRAPPRPQVCRHRGRVVVGSRPPVEIRHRVHERARHQEDGGHRPEVEDAPERVLRPQCLHRIVQHPSPRNRAVASKSASATSCGATTSPTPKVRGRTHASGSATPSGIARLTMRERSSGSLRQRSTTSISASCSLSPIASGPPRRISGRPAKWTSRSGKTSKLPGDRGCPAWRSFP